MRCHSRRQWSRVHEVGPQRPYEDWATVGGEAGLGLGGLGGPRWREEPAPADMGGTISEIYRVFFFTGPPLKR